LQFNSTLLRQAVPAEQRTLTNKLQ